MRLRTNDKLRTITGTILLLALLCNTASTERLDIYGTNGHQVVLENNADAETPTYDELIDFLSIDSTDEIPYDSKNFVCADYAMMVHNNAESAGIRAGVTKIDLITKEGYRHHLINVFETVDKGTVYYDCCISSGEKGDYFASVKRGYKYKISKDLDTWYYTLGRVTGFKNYW